MYFQLSMYCPYLPECQRKKIFACPDEYTRHLREKHGDRNTYVQRREAKAVAYFKKRDDWIRTHPAPPYDPANDNYPDFVPVSLFFRMRLIILMHFIIFSRCISVRTRKFADTLGHSRQLLYTMNICKLKCMRLNRTSRTVHERIWHWWNTTNSVLYGCKVDRAHRHISKSQWYTLLDVTKYICYSETITTRIRSMRRIRRRRVINVAKFSIELRFAISIVSPIIH